MVVALVGAFFGGFGGFFGCGERAGGVLGGVGVAEAGVGTRWGSRLAVRLLVTGARGLGCGGGCTVWVAHSVYSGNG